METERCGLFWQKQGLERVFIFVYNVKNSFPTEGIVESRLFMGTTLILVRHGESNANGNGFFAGQLDIGLSQRGLQQAELTAQYIRENYHVDAIYSSDLQRAYHTALPIAKACDVEIIALPQLREIFAGEWQGVTFDELQTRYSDSFCVWRNNIGKAQPPNGESVEALSDRIWNAVQEIVRKEEGKTVVIVTHATPIRTLMCRIKGMELNQMKQIPWVSNASLSVVCADDVWTLSQESFDLHLTGIKTQFPANV